MPKITDKDFRYTPSFSTDVRKRFQKIIRENRAAAAAAAQAQTGDVSLQNSVIQMSQERILRKA